MTSTNTATDPDPPPSSSSSAAAVPSSAMKFLRVVDKIQRIKRLEKAMKARERDSLGSRQSQQSQPQSQPQQQQPQRSYSSRSFPDHQRRPNTEQTPLLLMSLRNLLHGGGDASSNKQQQQQQKKKKSILTSDTETQALTDQEELNDNDGGGGGGGGGQQPSSSSLAATPQDVDNDDESGYSWGKTLSFFQDLLLGKGLVSACLLALPFAIYAVQASWSDVWIFWLNFTLLIPLAAILGDFTEEVAFHTNQMLGGLINATFGNAVEVVVALQALLADEIRVVQSSMLGSIFSNLLLVLGGCFFFGGCCYQQQSFNTTAATANMALLALSGIALVLPTPFAQYYELQDEHVLFISRLAAVFLFGMYLQLLLFQLYTHADLFDDDGGASSGSGSSSSSTTASTGKNDTKNSPKKKKNNNNNNTASISLPEEDELLEPPNNSTSTTTTPPPVVSNQDLATIPFWVACGGLLGTTLAVTYFSEALVSSIDGFVEESGISRTFVGMILLPIVGNAVEHVTAITVACKNKMDLAMGVAVGSCTQISLFVIPLTVLVGWMWDKPMTLNFPHFEIILFVLSVFTVSILCSTPHTNWLEGSLLMTTYGLIAVGFWFEQFIIPNESISSSSSSTESTSAPT